MDGLDGLPLAEEGFPVSRKIRRQHPVAQASEIGQKKTPFEAAHAGRMNAQNSAAIARPGLVEEDAMAFHGQVSPMNFNGFIQGTIRTAHLMSFPVLGSRNRAHKIG